MKLYDCTPAPNPRRVRIFMAEKGVQCEIVQVNLAEKEQLTDTFRQINPFCDVPVLELDDGTCISQVNGICRYLDAAFPEPNLYGKDAKEQGLIAMWDNYCFTQGFLSVVDAFRNFSKFFDGRATLGQKSYPQIPELAERGKNRTVDFFTQMNDCLSNREYLICDRFSAADITLFVTIEFAQRIKVEIGEDQKNLQRWYELVADRPSMQA